MENSIRVPENIGIVLESINNGGIEMEETKFNRIHLIVLDSVGIGASPDAHLFGDQGADTLGHIGEQMGGLKMPNMGRLGLSNIKEIKGIPVESNPVGVLWNDAGIFRWQRYDDRALGIDGLEHR